MVIHPASVMRLSNVDIEIGMIAIKPPANPGDRPLKG